MKLKELLLGLDAFVYLFEGAGKRLIWAADALTLLCEMDKCNDPRVSYPVMLVQSTVTGLAVRSGEVENEEFEVYI